MNGQHLLTAAHHVTDAIANDAHTAVLGSALLSGLLGFFALWALLFVAALVSVLGSPLTAGMKLVWAVASFTAPLLGPLVWFLFGRRDAYHRLPAHWT